MSSVAKVEESSGTMWRCENDILKDLAFLNDFGGAEPYKIFNSNGRGTKIKPKEKSSEKFIDPRTGETIDIDDSEFNLNENLHKGKGRGKHFGNLSSKNFQLQEQLRLARPLGSGDEAIESFCRRFKAKPPKTADGTNTSSVESQTSGTRSETSKPASRIIGSRNSVLQNNILISGLLSRGKDVNSTGGTRTSKDVSSTEDEDESGKSKSDVNSDASGTSIRTVFSDKDFPPLRTASDK